MERSTPVRKPHTSTADLLTWSESPLPDYADVGSTPRPVRDVQPSDGISKVVFGGQVTDEEVEILLKRKPCSDYKMKEMTGSGIFVGGVQSNPEEAQRGGATSTVTPNKTGLRMYQQAIAGMSLISFSADEESVSPRKPVTLTEAAKQRELSGNLGFASDEANMKKQLSDAKCKELSGHDIFAPPPEIKPRQLKKDLLCSMMNFGEEPVLKTAKKIPDQKFAHLSGNNILEQQGEEETLKSSEKALSSAKLKEISGNDIFADGKVESRDYLGGVRKPPGGESSIALGRRKGKILANHS